MESKSPLKGLAYGGFASCVAETITMPIDVVKTRLQVAGANPDVFSYRGPIDCLAKLIRAEGPAALFAGLVGRFLYAGPGFAIFLPTYDVLKRLALSGAGGAPRSGG